MQSGNVAENSYNSGPIFQNRTTLAEQQMQAGNVAKNSPTIQDKYFNTRAQSKDTRKEEY